MEEWRDIKGYEGKYQVSNLGRVKSLNYHRENREEILSNVPDKYGYLIVSLCKNGKELAFKIHRLVALHFIENPNNYPQINHKDENKQNNRADNLEWCTAKYNNNYGTRTQRQSEKLKGKHRTEDTKNKISNTRKDKGLAKGSKNPASRKIKCITTDKEFNCIREAGEYYKLTDSQVRHITNCCRGKRNYSGKHPITGEKLVWKYID